MDLIVVDLIAAVPVEQHEYSLTHRGQGTRLAGDHNPMSAAVNITSLIECIRECDFRRNGRTTPRFLRQQSRRLTVAEGWLIGRLSKRG